MTRLDHHDRLLTIGFAAVAGFVDAVGFLASHGFFLSFMSGNSTRMAVGISEQAVYFPLAALLLGSFVCGVTVGSLVGRLSPVAGRTRQGTILAMIGLLLSVAPFLAQQGHVYVALALAACAMGAENTLYEENGSIAFGLTYMTGALVKVGQGIAAMLSGGDRFAWFPYLLLWCGLLGGAVAGAAFYGSFGFDSLWLAALTALLLSATLLWAGKRRKPTA